MPKITHMPVAARLHLPFVVTEVLLSRYLLLVALLGLFLLPCPASDHTVFTVWSDIVKLLLKNIRSILLALLTRFWPTVAVFQRQGVLVGTQ